MSGESYSSRDVHIDEYVVWIEDKLRSISSIELSHLNCILDKISEGIINLKKMAKDFKNTMVASNSAHNNRFTKLHDQINTLIEPYSIEGRLFCSKGKLHPLRSTLPDAEILKDMIMNNKLKLKAVDEIASSKKSDNFNAKFKGSKISSSNRSENKKSFEISMIRSEIKSIFCLLDEAVAELALRLQQLNYFGLLKVRVHFPLMTFRNYLLAQNPTTELIANLEREYQNLLYADETYNQARCSKILVTAAVAQHEIRRIESILLEEDCLQIACLQSVAKENVTKLSPSSSSLTGTARPPADDFSGVSSNPNPEMEWYSDFQTYAKSSVPNLLRLCMNESVRVNVCYSIRQLQSFLAEIASDPQTNKKKLNALKSRLGAEVWYAILHFDFELFGAYVEDWTIQTNIYEKSVALPEFQSAYEALDLARHQLEMIQAAYEASRYRTKELLATHRNVVIQMDEIKERMVEVALSEVSEPIRIVE
mmetsp:Transcript_16619/g.27866  ORF Transcript_16619/g.27866 Transcript_16619/m.27866 type:complete len:480 (+) Transcript_16619:105-1544(+)